MTSPTRSPEARRSRERRRRTLAGLASITLHSFALIAWLSSGRGPPSAGAAAAGDAGAMSVEIVSASDIRLPASPESGNLHPLFAKYDTGVAPVSIPTDSQEGDLNRLFEGLEAREPRHPASGHTTSAATLPDAPASSAAMRTAASSSRGKAAASSASVSGATGGLWGAVQPCWKTLPGRSTVPVTLEVALDFSGRLSTPPKIIREGAALSEARLQAEARALSALVACLPRGDLRFSNQVYRLEFRPES